MIDIFQERLGVAEGMGMMSWKLLEASFVLAMAAWQCKSKSAPRRWLRRNIHFFNDWLFSFLRGESDGGEFAHGDGIGVKP